jgi:Tol biopolymer transport system component
VRLLVPTRDSNVTFIWSPDSRSLIVGAAGKKQNQLWLVPIDGGGRKVLVTASRAGLLPRPEFWTPGSDLVYDEVGTGPTYFGFAVRELSVRTGQTRVLWRTTNPQAEGPIMSPNLREWAYIGEVDQYHQKLRILDRATGKSHVVSGVNPTNLVAWSPDSRSLAVIESLKPHQGESGWRVVTIAPDGKLQHRIGPGETILWGRDGQLFILQGPYDQVWASRNGGPERLLFRLPGHNVISVDSN